MDIKFERLLEMSASADSELRALVHLAIKSEYSLDFVRDMKIKMIKQHKFQYAAVLRDVEKGIMKFDRQGEEKRKEILNDNRDDKQD